MAGRGNPSFLKNQKAQKRVARANAKRAARQARHAERAASRVEGQPLAEQPAPADGETSEGNGQSVESKAEPGT